MWTEVIYSILVPIVIALLASSGFWVFLEKRTQRSSIQNDLLLGLAHDRIIYLAMKYIRRGWVSHDEYENLTTYLYKPYQKMGGNGTAVRLMEELNKLPIKHQALEFYLKKEDKE